MATHTDAPGESGPHGTKVIQPPAAPADIAKHFPQLEILECLGRGGMGVVYKARQPKLNRLVALKLLAPEKGADPRFAERFLREAQALARLSHPNIVTVHDFGEADGLYYLLMEYVDGVTLRQLLQTRKIAPEEALGIVPKICEALQFAHELGVVHRDIKPENVLLDRQGRVKIADFGIAKLVGGTPLTPSLSPSDAARVSGGTGEGTLTQDQVLGTPNYMAPEQVDRPQLVDHRADIYSLGVVFYEMLTGELPLGKFQAPSKKVQVDVRLDEVVLHALEKEPERRYQQASDVKTAVEAIAAGPGAPAPTPAAGQPVRLLRWRDLWPWDTTYITAFLIAPMVGAAFLVAMLLPQHASKVPWFLGCALLGICIAAGYLAVGYRIRRLKAALRRPTGEIAECLIYRKPLKTPGLAVLHPDRLELIPVSGPPMTVALANIVAVAEVRWFVAQFLWWKKGFVLELANGQRVGLAVAEVFARRWRSRLSRGSLPEIGADSESAAPSGAGPVQPGPKKAVWRRLGWSLAVMGIAAVFLLLARPFVLHQSQEITDLANQPDQLRRLSTVQVINVGLGKPDLPWAWQELQQRARNGRLSAAETGNLTEGLVAWMRRNYPNGYRDPLHWLRPLLDELGQDKLVTEAQALRFLVTFHGNPTLEPLMRLREGEHSLQLDCTLRNIWQPQLLGMVLLDEVRSITVDGQPIPLPMSARPSWRNYRFFSTLELPDLATGIHTLKCEVESALVAESDVAGLPDNAPSSDWPPTKRRWKRVTEARLEVFARNAEIVGLTRDPALDPVASGGLTAKSVIIRRKGQGATAVILFDVTDKLPVPISFDVTLRLAGESIPCGSFWNCRTTEHSMGSGNQLGADLDVPDSQIKEADLILTPSPRQIEAVPGVTQVWGKEAVFNHVPLTRQDLDGAKGDLGRD
jgi:tRNA A-37 threonylcarbamoyl transferase component Bud32